MPSDVHYQTLGGGMTQALEKQKARQRRSKRIVIGLIVGVVVLIAAGVTAGVLVAKNNNKSSSSSSSGGSKTGSSSGSGSGSTGSSDDSSSLDDPSNFAKDSRYHKSFYGMAYTPEGSLMPNCGSTLENVIRDVQLLSQLTSRVRLYGADCNQTALVLEAIRQTKVDLNVFAAIYVVPDEPVAYTRQRDNIKNAIETYGADHIAGITVGNEFMLNYLTKHKATDPNSAVGLGAAKLLIANIEDTRSMIADLKLDKTIPVGNSDAGSFFNTQVMSAIDYGLSNVHAWFANTTAEGAADWVNKFFQETNVDAANLLPNKPKMYIAETGWPTKSSDAGNANNGASTASEGNLQIFLDTFVCQANQNSVGYFYFELFDEEWKDKIYGGVEGWWGLFNKDRTLKDITLPDCAAP